MRLCYNPSAAVRKRTDSPAWLARAGALTAIPFVLLIGPVLGYYVGTRIDDRAASSPWGMTIGIVLGLLASARLTIQLIRQTQDRHPDD